MGLRIIDRLEGRSQSWLAINSGISEKTISDYIHGGIASTSAAVKIAEVLQVTVDWLLTGTKRANPAMLVDVEDADFVGLPRYDLTLLKEDGKGRSLEVVPIRRDWLTRRVGTANGLWITEMPSTYDELGLWEGDAVICSDIPRDHSPPDNTTCFFLGEGLFVARYRNQLTYEVGDNSGPRVGPLDLAEHGTQPIARIRARMLTRV